MVEYIEKIQYPNGETHELYSDCCRGKWVAKYLSLASAVQYEPNSFTKYDISSYLPDDGFDYEVLASFIGNTQATVGSNQYWWIRSGSDAWMGLRPAGVRTATATTENCAGAVIIPIRASNKVIGIFSEAGSTSSGNCYFYLCGYRRLGKNDWNTTEGMHKVRFSDGREMTLGGKALPGKWVVKRADLWTNYNMPAKSDSIRIDLSSMVPNDGYDYECIMDGTANSPTTNHQYADVRFSFLNTGIWVTVNECLTRSGDNLTKINYFNFRVPIFHNAKYIDLRNYGNGICKVNFRFEGYRRLGFNG